jgi:hypothetical protein
MDLVHVIHQKYGMIAVFIRIQVRTVVDLSNCLNKILLLIETLSNVIVDNSL